MWRASEMQLNQIKKYAQYGYSPDRIAILMDIWGRDKDDFLILVSDESASECQAYLSGEAIGASNADNTLEAIISPVIGKDENGADINLNIYEGRDIVAAAKELAAWQKNRRVKDLKRRLFGL